MVGLGHGIGKGKLRRRKRMVSGCCCFERDGNGGVGEWVGVNWRLGECWGLGGWRGGEFERLEFRDVSRS